MKKFKSLFVLMMAVALMASFTITMTASAQEKLIETEIKEMVVKKDKNGNDYVRFIIQEDRSLNGINYKTDVVTMVFGEENVKKAQELYSPGDILKAIASVNQYQGRTNYSIIAFIN